MTFGWVLSLTIAVLAMLIAGGSVAFAVLQVCKTLENMNNSMAANSKRITQTLEEQAKDGGSADAQRLQALEARVTDLHETIERRYKRMYQERQRIERAAAQVDEAAGVDQLELPEEMMPEPGISPARRRARRGRRR